MKNKKASNTLYQVVMQIILIALIFALFFFSATSKVNSKGTKQQVLEKQTALFIDAAASNTTLAISKINKYGKVSNLKVEAGRVFIFIGDQETSRGYPYFTKYQISLESDNDYYYIKIRDKK